MLLRSSMIIMLALGASACSGRIVPPSATSPARIAAPVPSSKAAAAAVLVPTPISPVAPPTGTGLNAVKAGVMAGPSLDSVGITPTAAARALTAFRASCPVVTKRSDQSGMTLISDWKPACAAASGWSQNDALGFFTSQFELVQVGAGTAFATGYYEPEIAGSRVRAPGYDVPIYRRPPDLTELDLGAFSKDLVGKKIRGKIDGNRFVPYADRAAIEDGALAGRGLELAWAASSIDFFVLQVQGSGRIKFSDGGVMQIGYDSQNGHDYTGIGRVMRDRNLLAPGKATMQDIVAYVNANPEEGRAIMRENRSWVFFREAKGGPFGALGVQVTGRASVAADPMFTPLGAPVLLSMDRAEANGLWVAQDTGGAIKGANRFDTFWGAGAEAFRIAGGMSARGTAFILLPKGVLARLQNVPKAP